LGTAGPGVDAAVDDCGAAALEAKALAGCGRTPLDGAGMTAEPQVESPPNQSPDRRAMMTLILVSGGRVLLLGSWFYATRLLANTIGPASFGVYVLAQNAIKILTGCIGDPLDIAVMREAPLLLRSQRPRALQLIRSAFWLRVLIAGAMLLLAAALPRLSSTLIFSSPDLRGLAVLTISGVLGDFLLRSGLGYFQVAEKFGRFMVVDAVWQLGRVVTAIALYLTHHLTAATGIAMYVAAPYVCFAVAWFLLPGDVARPAPPHRGDVGAILHYTKWIVAGMAMAAAYERLDVWFLARFRTDYDVGVYGGAVLLASIPDFLNGILQTSLAPRVAPAYADGTFNQLQRWYLRYAVPFGLLAAAGAMLLGGWAIRTFFSAQYADSVPAFRILVLSTLFNLVFTPLPAALVNFVAPARVTIYTSVGLIWVAAGGLIFIPKYGATGAAVVMLTARIAVGILIIAQAMRLARKPGFTHQTPLPANLPQEV
jgi:O-antigen/teichoic acid export membrane protein